MLRPNWAGLCQVGTEKIANCQIIAHPYRTKKRLDKKEAHRISGSTPLVVLCSDNVIISNIRLEDTNSISIAHNINIEIFNSHQF